MNEPLSKEQQDRIVAALTGREVKRTGGGDHTSMRKAEEVVATPDSDHSWLGRWADVGWAVRITPRLTEEQWGPFYARAEETWNPHTLNYDPMKSLELLQELLPKHDLALVWPKCGKRVEVYVRDKGRRMVSVCGAQAQHTEVHQRDVNGARVGIARCDRHRGQL